MENKTVVIALFIAIYFGLCQPLYSWEKTYTHPALSQEAANLSQINTYLQSQLRYTAGLNTQLQITDITTPFVQDLIDRGMDPSVTARNILEWLREGTELEDALIRQARSQHHFHDPIRNAGLDNRTDYPDWESFPTRFSPFDLRGESALFWITIGTSSTGYPKNNQETWLETRNKFYNALTSPVASNREQYLAETFLALGHILHMLEDMGVAAHTRNDFLFGHYRTAYKWDWGNPLEGWAEDQVKANDGQSPWSGTGPVIFDKLAKYFDADTYSGDYLGAGVSPPDTWGLSECTNYQFLSLSTVFGCSGVKYQFPHPAKEHTSKLVEGRKVYFDGSNYGVVHLARDSYTYYAGASFGYASPVIDNTNTTDDEKVFIDYANITIPRTIDYTTGLANYFFRGRLNVEPNWLDPNTVKLTITNDSNNSGVPQTLKAGTFEIYWDDTNDTRAQINPAYITFIPEWTPASTLPNDNGLTELIAQFAPPAENVKKYVVVYRGNICENPADPDPNDLNAIAVYVLPCGYKIIAWGDPEIGDKYGQISNVPEGNDFIDVAAGTRHCLALRSDGSLVAWGFNTYGECNVPDGADYTAIAAGTNHSIALKSDGSIVVWGRDNLWQTTDKPSGNDFVAIAAGAYHSLALKTNDIIVGWGGWNDFGECDAPASDPGTVYTAIAAGSYHSLALQSDGTIKAWGNNNLGQTEIYAGAGNDHEAIAACFNHNLLLKEDDTLITWGGGDWHEPGLPRYHYRQTDGTDFVAIAAGWDHILALTSDGEIFAWDWPDGDYPFDYFSRTVPEGIVFTDDIAAGNKFSLSLKAPQ